MKVAQIQYSPANILASEDLARVQPIKIGDPLRAAEVASAIDGLFATGRFQNISVEAEAATGGGVSLRFLLIPQLFVGGVNVTGKVSGPPNRGQLESASQMTLGSTFSDDDLTRAAAGMTRLLRSNGLYDSTVSPRIERDDEGQQAFISFELSQGQRAKYRQPEFEGNKLLSDATVLRATGWRVPVIHWWRKVTAARTSGGVQNVLGKYQNKDRLLADVDVQKLDYDSSQRTVTPHLKIIEGPKIQIESVEDKVSRRVLKRYVPVFEDRSVDNDLLVAGERNLQDYLQSQGYYDADIDFRVQPLNNDVETIQYVISRGQRYKVVKLFITGNSYFDQNTIRERMFIQPAAFNRRHGRYSEAFERRDAENITSLYKANGFRDATVTMAVQQNYLGKAGQIAVTVKIAEGTQWLVDKLSIEGISQADRQEVMSVMTSLPGQPFSESGLAADRNALVTWYYAHGFPAATLRVAWQPTQTAPTRVDATYTIVEGNRQFVRGILTSGLHTTRQDLVDRHMTIKPGQPLSPVAEAEVQRGFYDLGIFARVDTAIENQDGDTNYKYLLYNFQEANRYDLSLGLGAQIARFGQPSQYSLGSPAGTTGFSPEFSLNASRLNFRGLGHTVSLRAVYSSIDRAASLVYLQPRFRNSAERSLTYTVLFDEERDVRTFTSRREEASVQLSQRFSKSLTGLFGVTYRRVSTSDVIIPVLLVPQLLQPVRLGLLTANFVQDRRDNSVNPHRGMYNTADFEFAGKYLGSQRSFVRALLRNATYYNLTHNLILARQTQFGVILPYDAPEGLTAQESVPLPERFFAGGADSLRAFAFNEAGPRDTGAPVVPGGPSSQPTGFPLGGNALFVNNVELRFPLIGENIQGVLFHDMGNVYDTLGDISFRFHQRNLQDFNYMVHAVGFGIRYKTPVGPIRVDLAYSINSPSFQGFNGTPQQLLQCGNQPTPNPPPGCEVTTQNTGHFQFFFSIGQAF